MNNELNTYLTFKVKDHTFGVSVDQVLEISEFSTPKPIPESPSYMLGVIEFRNQVVPIVDCGEKFNLKPIDINELSCIVILDLYNDDLSKRFKVGIVVDAVSDVFEAKPEQLMSMEDDYRPGYILTSYKTDDILVLILDANKVFSEKDIITIDQIVNKVG